MRRLCERPGCSDVAAVSYGMRTADLVFWVDALEAGAEPAPGVLCQRHGDSMVVPRGWTLDDLRDPHLHLFRPPAVIDSVVPRPSRRRTVPSPDPSTQLALDGVRPNDESDAMKQTELATDTATSTSTPGDDGRDMPLDFTWHPTFDTADDLGGLLSARSPLLSRAFRGIDRPT